MIDSRRHYLWAKWAIAYLLIVALLGVLLRGIIIYPLEGVNYKNFLHAHSHVAFLGWVFNALFVAVVYSFLPAKTKAFKWIFILLQVSVLGMMVSFPLQGYAFYSIMFSTFHVLLSWYFAYKVFKLVGNMPFSDNVSVNFIKLSLVWMVISSLGPLSLGIILAKGLAGTSLYQMAIHFYLHFQYDGWFTFAVMGLFFRMLIQAKISYDKDKAGFLFKIMAIICVPAYSLSVLWASPTGWVYGLAVCIGIIQLVVLIPLISVLHDVRMKLVKKFGGFLTGLIFFAFAALVLKIILQFVVVFPGMAEMAYDIRNFAIGFLHLVLLGFVTTFLLAWMGAKGFINVHLKNVKVGFVLFLLSFCLTEVYIFAQPLLIMLGLDSLPYYHGSLFFISLMFPVSVMIFLTARKDRTSFLKGTAYRRMFIGRRREVAKLRQRV